MKFDDYSNAKGALKAILVNLAVIILVLQVSCFKSLNSFYSILAGNLSWFLPNSLAYFRAKRLGKNHEVPSEHLKHFYQIELTKWVLSMASLSAALIWFPEKFTALIGFIAAVIVSLFTVTK